MNRPAMNIVTRSVVMPHRGDKEWKACLPCIFLISHPLEERYEGSNNS